ncbi:MAG TPA: prepilin-type N-terminal cleavage/methylation domain-containing protein [Candidatus Acidoferrum sp.]|jgi:prepilin-type N-terminal cleavage/methylation domain-containing protein|nr:prepilin-type N-terminal cleavage/methylation domain-containing protein [Candidatus Acidoferrum sp.]
MQRPFTKRRQESGFSLLEMLLATTILLVGLIAVAQLVPASILLNSRNRTDSSALVFAQREMDQFLDQPLSTSTFQDVLLNTCNLGNAATPNVVQGSPLVNNQALINFAAAPAANYSFTYTDPNDPSGTSYDVRWAVIVTGNGSAASSKRFILGIRQQGGNGFFQPVTLDMMVGK